MSVFYKLWTELSCLPRSIFSVLIGYLRHFLNVKLNDYFDTLVIGYVDQCLQQPSVCGGDQVCVSKPAGYSCFCTSPQKFLIGGICQGKRPYLDIKDA